MNGLQLLVMTAWFFTGSIQTFAPQSTIRVPISSNRGPYVTQAECDKARNAWLSPPVYNDMVEILPEEVKAGTCHSEKIHVIYLPIDEE